MKLNRTNKKVASLFFAVLMITSVFAAFVMMPVVATCTYSLKILKDTPKTFQSLLIVNNRNIF